MGLPPMFPDGYLLDHFAEFSYLSQEGIRGLYESDPVGYRDSVGMMCHTLLTGREIGVSGDRVREEPERLREELLTSGRARVSQFFDEKTRSVGRTLAQAQVRMNWGEICARLSGDELVQSAVVGLVTRDAQRHWGRGGKLRPSHYVSLEDQGRLPEDIRDRLYRSVTLVEWAERVDASEGQTLEAIDGCVSTHYRTGFEYCNGIDRKGGLYAADNAVFYL